MKMKHTFLVAVVYLAVFSSTSLGAEVVDPVAFDKNGDRLLDKDELRLYVIKRDGLKPDLNVFMTDDLTLKPDALTLIKDDLFDQADFRVGGIYAKLGVTSGSPVSVDQVRQLQRSGKDPNADKDLRIPGFFAESKKGANSSVGPFLLRKSADGWDKDLKKAQGAKISYADNRETDKTTWSTEGALIYPISFSADYTSYDRESSIRSERWLVLPSASWKVNKIAQTQKGDVEEFQGQIPAVWSANHANLGWLRNSEVALSPFVLTDFSFEGVVWGLSASYSPYIFDGDSGFGINTGYKGLGSSPFMYRLGLAASLDYNHLSRTSGFITREGRDNYFRGGGKTEIGLITKGYPSIETSASYQALAGISGAPDYSDLLSLSAKLWLNQHAGFSVEYQRGNTPVAQKDIDLLTVGLELKF